MKTVFFGGAFDPVHNAHLSMANHLIDKGLASKVIFVPVYSPPHRKEHDLSKYIDRVNMLRLALEGKKRFEINDIESRLAGPSYTYRTLNHLKNNTDEDIALMIGEDQLAVFDTWYEYKRIIEEYQIIIFDRGEKISDDLKRIFKGKDIILTDHAHRKISSTMIRKMIREGRDVSEYLPERVIEYIKEKDLYRS